MRIVLLVMSILFYSATVHGQQEFIQIETNKTIGIFSFMEASSGQLGTSFSYQEWIDIKLGEDTIFQGLVMEYDLIIVDYALKRDEYPENRASYISTKELLWIAASNSRDLDDFNQRIIGILPHPSHTKFINILRQAEIYYDQFIWIPEQENIARIEAQLSKYKTEIEALFFKISHFYGTSWNKEIPFKIALYPIPLENGHTTAIPKGNALICSFLAHNEEDYKVRLGISVHEMCHILYSAQPLVFQFEMDDWFEDSSSNYAALSYTFLDEALATVLGNGWAYEQIHGEVDQEEWYNNEHINGFAHALYPLTKSYLDEEKSIDQDFINEAIALFGTTFPKSPQETAVLMNNVEIFYGREEEIPYNEIFEIHEYFNIRSMSFSAPINASESIERFDRLYITKVFIIDSAQQETIKALDTFYKDCHIETPINSIDILKDPRSKSMIFVVNIASLDELPNVYRRLSEIKYVEEGKNYKLK